MSNIPQINLSWYFDELIEQREKEVIGAQYPRYVGHSLMVPNVFDYHVLERKKNARVLFHQPDCFSMLLNVCRHHQMIMLKEKGNTEKVICPTHRWTYSTRGELLTTPMFESSPCMNLENEILQSFHGYLFQSQSNFSFDLPKQVLEQLQVENFQFNRIVIQDCPFNWKIFVEVYLDNYHIPFIHHGLRKLIDIDSQECFITENSSVQFVNIRSNLGANPSPHYQRYQDIINNKANGVTKDMRIMWLALYPDLMIEKYPYVLVVSTINPTSVHTCTNITEFYFDNDATQEHPDLPQAFISAYAETAAEDNDIGQQIHNGRQALYSEMLFQDSIHHPVMEKGLPSFYEFMQKIISS